MTTIGIYVMLVLVIILAARYYGSPKLASNLLLTLAFSVVVGLGIKSFESVKTTKTETKKELVTKVNQQPMQSSNVATFVTTTADILKGIASKAENWFTLSNKETLQLVTIPYLITRDPPGIVNDS